MNLSFYIAKRYLFAKKSQNVINIISAISMGGVAVGTMALIVVLSVFNGFDSLVRSLYDSFNPDLKISLVEGKTFTPDPNKLEALNKIPGVLDVARVLEDKALLRYGNKQTIAIVKGVSSNFDKVTGIDTMIIDGKYILKSNNADYCVIGQGISLFLGVGLKFTNPINMYVPRRTEKVSLNPERAINRKFIFPSGVFSIQQDYDSRYVLVPLSFARDLLGYTTEVSDLELKLNPGYRLKSIQKQVKELFGPQFKVKNQYQQNELFYKTMQSEKWAIFLILAFILIVASFNVIGSLTMLIIEKKNDIVTLRNLGADLKLIRNIFLREGWMISIGGAILGMLLGLFICWLQIRFEFVKLQGSGTFVIDAYPVEIKFLDIIAVFITVIVIGFFASWYPIRYITRRFIRNRDGE